MLNRTALGVAVVLAVSGLATAATLAGKIDLKDFKMKGTAGDNAGYNEGEGKLFFYAPDTAEAAVKLAADGEYTITVEASCDAAKDENAKFTLKVGDEVIKKDFLLTASEQKEYTFTAKLKKGEPKLSIEFTNDLYKEGEYDRNLYVHGVKVEAKK
jgi:hypothetical protein